jgi:hypothetical protein
VDLCLEKVRMEMENEGEVQREKLKKWKKSMNIDL